jgi:hypothetical protein
LALENANRRAQSVLCLLLAICGVLVLSTRASAQLRIVTYNTTSGFPGDELARPEAAIVLQAIGQQSVNGIAKPIDVLLLQEQFDPATSTQSFVDMLNGIYGPGVYARSVLKGLTSDPLGRAGAPALVYNTQTVQLISEARIGTVNGSNQARSSMRYQLRPLGYGPAADFYAYNDHYKADSTSSDQARRQIEAANVRANADALGQGVHIIYAGDYNVQSAAEQSFQTMLAPGNGQAEDPLDASGTPNAPVTWHENSAYKAIHTQDPGGQMDDRFDFQLVTSELRDGEGMSIIPGSYRAFGNNGTHTFNSQLFGTGASSAVLTALRNNTDHLPVVADYQLPAKMQVDVAAIPTYVLLGSSATFPVTITNSAPAVAAIGVDELEYSLDVSGSLMGSTTGVDMALGGGNTHAITLDTTTLGLHLGQIAVTSSSPQAANATFLQSVSYRVIESFLAADFNRDGAVNAVDLTAWAAHQGLAAGAVKAQGDADGDGDVDGDDFMAWQQQIGQLPVGAAISAVPEPSAALLALAALIAALRVQSCPPAGDSYSKSRHFIARRKGSIRNIVSPF